MHTKFPKQMHHHTWDISACNKGVRNGERIGENITIKISNDGVHVM